MSQTTKRALSASLKALLSQRCLDNITVKDIVEDCEVNRQTFYYHFQDIYDLLRWTFEQEAERLLAGKKDTDTWQEGFLSTFRYVLANRAMVLHVFRSAGRDHLDRCLYAMVHQLMYHVMDESCGDLDIDEADKSFIADFYKYAFVGIMLDWIRDDMKADPEVIVARVARLVEGDFRRGAERFAR